MVGETKRIDHNERFLRRVLTRRPEAHARYQVRLAVPPDDRLNLESFSVAGEQSLELVWDTIASEERLVLMIVDERQVLSDSHNWGKPGVSLNRDASLIFDDAEIADYYSEAFEVDWERSNPVRLRRFFRSESPVLEAVGIAPPPGYRCVRLSDWLKDD